MSFFQLLHHKSPTREEDDKVRWDLKKNGVFDIQFYYHAIHGNVDTGFHWKSIWGVKAPRRVAFFVWTAAWGRILTCDNLRRCCMCRCSGETVNHLLLHCTAAREIWSYVFRLFGVDWVILGCVLDLVAGWRNWFGKQSLEVWNLVPLCHVVHMEGEK